MFQIARSDWQTLKVSNGVEGSPNDPSVLCVPGHRHRLAKKRGQAAGRTEGDGYRHVGRPTWLRKGKCILSPVVSTTG
jgi:hypothetical protein